MSIRTPPKGRSPAPNQGATSDTSQLSSSRPEPPTPAGHTPATHVEPAPPSSPSAKNPYTLVFLILASIATLWLCYIMAKPFLTAVLFAAVMAVVFYPIHLRMFSVIRRPNLAALATTVLVLLLVVLPVVGLGTAVKGEIGDAYAFLEHAER